MAGEGFEVRPSDLTAGASTVTQASAALASGRTASTGAVDQAAGASGSGPLAAALGAFGSGLDTGAELLGREMDLTATALSGAAATYRSTDRSAASGIRSVAVPAPNGAP